MQLPDLFFQSNTSGFEACDLLLDGLEFRFRFIPCEMEYPETLRDSVQRSRCFVMLECGERLGVGSHFPLHRRRVAQPFIPGL